MTIDEAITWLQRYADNTPMHGAREEYKMILEELEWERLKKRLEEMEGK